MLLEVIESMNEKIDKYYPSLQQLGNTPEHTQSQKTVDARKEGMFHGEIISSHLIGKADNNYSQFWR